MIVIRCWQLYSLAVLTAIFAMDCSAFNVDVDSATVHYGPNNSMFGYRAEFIKQNTGSARLLVSAPHLLPATRMASGNYFSCDPLGVMSCQGRNTLPPDVDTHLAAIEEFGEKKEMFGQTMTLVNSSTALMCAPLWAHRIGWKNHHIFPIGRCQLVPPGSDTLSPLTKNVNEYLGNVFMDGHMVLGFLKGFSLFGFSAASDGEGHVVVGTPGFSSGRGSFGILTLNSGEFDMMEKDTFDKELDVNLGFTITVGDFCDGRKICFAASNRMSNGKVYVVAREHPKVFRVMQMLQGSQNYSSFGFSLCAMDINGDGLSDLLVGAPTYSDHTTDPTSYDVGRVFVYQQVQGKLLANITLAGGRKSFSRFGSAIGNIGDINRDSIDDVAVGAPQEDEGRGAVYIYLGSSKGPETTFSQRISGRDIGKGLFSFGSHISQPTSDISAYKYPDFAVGSPQSDAVVVLRTRLIINAVANILVPASGVESSNNLCPANLSMVSLKASGCISLGVCISFSVGLTRPRLENLLFDVSFGIDTLLPNEGSRRVRLYRGQGYPTVTSVNETVTVNAKNAYCKSYVAILKEDQILRNPFIPVKVEASFNLNFTSIKDIISPILNASLPTSATAEVKFLNKCGADQTCRADLLLQGRVLHVPSEMGLDLNVVNSTSEVVLDLTLTNRQETAYGIKLTVNVQGQIRFITATDDDGGSQFLCEVRDSKENSTLDQAGFQLSCISWFPLPQGGALSVKLQFDAASVPLEAASRVVTFAIISRPYDSAQNPEAEMNDNIINLESRKALVADLQVIGSSDPRSLHIYDSTHLPLQAAHKLLITNRGPSFMPATHVNISLPYMDMEGRELLTSYSVTIKLADGTVTQCAVLSVDAIVMTTTEAIPSSSSASVNVSTLLPPATETPESESITFGIVEPSRRRRQANVERTFDSSQKSSKNRDSSRSLQMDCRGYKCKTFQCSLPTLQRYVQAEVDVSFVINNAVLPFSSKVDSILYTTLTSVGEPSTPFFYRWPEPRAVTVATPIYKVTSFTEISIWFIVGGVIGGLLALVIIAVILKKVGFFQRQDKARLERLKRQNGFYQTPRRPPSTRRA
ncbi:hypothetical protein C0Q70_09163 [Pomacea canaliculata]|uniref:Uncharacterized protein n=1 Tax=Pomacea canaliculata TaxID=400727 RepID=A0A2T7P933_POMCA|nr:hypothetical protein C0Q70_09163 [Pomacea canaliculata]